MGVDYDAVCGIGVEITTEIVERMIWDKKFTQADWDDSCSACLDTVGIPYHTAGDGCYGGTDRYYWTVEGSNLQELNDNACAFINKVSRYCGPLTLADLRLITDILVW